MRRPDATSETGWAARVQPFLRGELLVVVTAAAFIALSWVPTLGKPSHGHLEPGQVVDSMAASVPDRAHRNEIVGYLLGEPRASVRREGHECLDYVVLDRPGVRWRFCFDGQWLVSKHRLG